MADGILWLIGLGLVGFVIYLAIRYEQKMRDIQDAQDLHEAELLATKERLARTAALTLGEEKARVVAEAAERAAEQAIRARPRHVRMKTRRH